MGPARERFLWVIGRLFWPLLHEVGNVHPVSVVPIDLQPSKPIYTPEKIFGTLWPTGSWEHDPCGHAHVLDILGVPSHFSPVDRVQYNDQPGFVQHVVHYSENHGANYATKPSWPTQLPQREIYTSCISVPRNHTAHPWTNCKMYRQNSWRKN